MRLKEGGAQLRVRTTFSFLTTYFPEIPFQSRNDYYRRTIYYFCAHNQYNRTTFYFITSFQTPYFDF